MRDDTKNGCLADNAVINCTNTKEQKKRYVKNNAEVDWNKNINQKPISYKNDCKDNDWVSYGRFCNVREKNIAAYCIVRGAHREIDNSQEWKLKFICYFHVV